MYNLNKEATVFYYINLNCPGVVFCFTSAAAAEEWADHMVSEGECPAPVSEEVAQRYLQVGDKYEGRWTLVHL